MVKKGMKFVYVVIKWPRIMNGGIRIFEINGPDLIVFAENEHSVTDQEAHSIIL